jgi:hypothetical protein
MTVIYAFPPVASVASMWTEIAPVRGSRSAVDGRRFVSSAGPRRRTAMVMVPALAKARDGAGYSESLKRFLDGGMNLIRLNSPAVNWHLDRSGPYASAPLGWQVGGAPVAWTVGGDPLYWFSGPVLTATVTTVGEFDAVSVSGLTPGSLACRAYDVLRTYAVSETTTSATARAVRTVYADDAGVAVIPLHSALPAGVISIGDQESAVFEVDGDMPSSPQPLGQNWFYEWRFREVLPAEHAGASEVNPWT